MNHPEVQRLQDVEDKKARGKGVPKKAKSKGTFLRSAWVLRMTADISTRRRESKNEQKEKDVGIDEQRCVYPPLKSCILASFSKPRQCFNMTFLTQQYY